MLHESRMNVNLFIIYTKANKQFGRERERERERLFTPRLNFLDVAKDEIVAML